MRRREFIAGLGSAISLPFRANGEVTVPVVGLLRSTGLADAAYVVNTFKVGLKEAGYDDGRNVTLVVRYAENRPERLPALAAELIDKKVSVIAANSVAALAAKSATSTIPIVFTTGSDPVRDGLVTSLSRPAGNVTGVVFITGDLGAKRLTLLQQFIPKATTIGILIYPQTGETEAERKELLIAAKAMDQQLVIIDVTSDGEIESAFATLAQTGARAVLLGSGPFMFSKRDQLVALANRHAIPTMHTNRESVVSGGLMSYGTNINDAYRLAGIYAGRILKGEKPSDLPVVQSSKFEFIINLNTARKLGLEFHPQLLGTADEVIE